MASTLPDGSWISSSKRAGTRCKSSKKNALEKIWWKNSMPKFQTQPWSIQANSETKWHQETHHVRKTIRSSSSSLSVKLCLQRSTWLAATSCLGGRIQLDYESNLQNSATIWLCKWQNIATTNMILMLYGDNQCAPST